jgi:hypothetical protein
MRENHPAARKTSGEYFDRDFSTPCSGFREVKLKRAALACRESREPERPLNSDDHIVRRDFNDCKQVVGVFNVTETSHCPAKNHCSKLHRTIINNSASSQSVCVVSLHTA